MTERFRLFKLGLRLFAQDVKREHRFFGASWPEAIRRTYRKHQAQQTTKR